jgi:hypothetical protein
MNFFKTTMPSSTVQSWFEKHESELINFPHQPNHFIWTLLNHSGQFWRREWGMESHLQHL